MRIGTALLVTALVAMLGVAVYICYQMWTSISNVDSGINGNGMAALVIGGIGTLVVGGGLMALVFYSSRRGYDDAADFKAGRPEDR